ncbi:MAG TPA: hypothetical protein DCR55_13455, partial [Lentisphaeria bacterium]|nr:hypothetical protein [Lentisphaeria bacterium]
MNVIRIAVLIAVSLVFIVSAEDDLRVKRWKHPNGNLKRKAEYYIHMDGKERLHGRDRWMFANRRPYKSLQWRDGKLDGPAIVWYENKRVHEKGEYRDGKRIGDWQFWHDNGSKMAAGHYDEGQPVGPWTEWGQDGKKIRVAEFRNGERNGPQEHFWPNGRLRYKGTYKNGKRNGRFERYFDTGALESEVSYRNNVRHGLARYYYDSGSAEKRIQRSEYNFENNAFAGEARTWNMSGDLLAYGRYQGDLPFVGTFWEEGPDLPFTITRIIDGASDVTAYDPTPTVYTITRYDNGAPIDGVLYDNGAPVTGLLVERFGDRQESYLCEYEAGRKHGREIDMWENGEARSEGSWESNKLNGVYREYRENGMIEWEVQCRSGQKDGRESRWDNYGNLTSQGVWRAGKPWSGLLLIEDTIETKMLPAEVVREDSED